MTFKNLIRIFSDKGCHRLYVKELQRNNNSKQQIYISRGDTQILNLFPVESFRPASDGNRKTISFHANLKFSWVDEEGKSFPAPHAKFILYPDYPEVRFSGFVQGCKKAPSKILNNKVPGRLLFFGISDKDEVLGFAVEPDSDVANEFKNIKNFERFGIIYSLNISNNKIKDSKKELLKELKRIHELGWINSKQLKKDKVLAPCNESRCGGLTLEAELGIIQNSKSEPDFLGWEVKQYGVKKFTALNSGKITLMTPEPDGGFYGENPSMEFIKKYGYPSKVTIDRIDFTGTHRSGKTSSRKLKIEVRGYDESAKKIIDPFGGIFLIDENDENAGSWSFSKLLDHWNRKHAKASYIPSLI